VKKQKRRRLVMEKKEKVILQKAIFIPNVVMQSNEISQGAKLCYGTLLHFAGKDGNCFPSIKQIAETMNVTPRQVINYLHELENARFIRIRRPKQVDKFIKRNNNYYFVFRKEFKKDPRVEKSELKNLRAGRAFNPLGTVSGAFLPLSILADKRLSAGAKLCLARLQQYDLRRGVRIFPSIDTLRKELGLKSKSQVYRYLKKLRKFKFVVKKKFRNLTRYFVRMTIFFKEDAKNLMMFFTPDSHGEESKNDKGCRIYMDSLEDGSHVNEELLPCEA